MMRGQAPPSLAPQKTEGDDIMALLDITGGTTTNSNLVQPAVGGDSRTAPLPDAFVSSTVAQKLDADYYTATEMGDNSEGIAGSGNLNHAILQAQQNDLLADNSAGDPAYTQDMTLGSLAAGIASGYSALAGVAGGSTAPSYTVISESSGGGSVQSSTTSAAQFMSATTAQNAGSGSISSDILAAPATIDAASGSSGTNGTPGPAGQNGTNGTNGTNGSNGTDGSNGSGDHCCGGTTLIDIDVIGPITIGPVITGPLIDLGEVTTIVTNITQNVTNITENITTVLPDVITTITTTVTNILNPILQPPPAGSDTDLVVDLGIADLPLLNDTLHVGLDLVESIVGDIDINLGIDGVLQGSDTTVSLDGILLGGTLPELTVSLPVTVEEILHDPFGSMTQVVMGLPETLQTLTQGLTGDLLAPPSSGDTDILANLGIADVPVLGDTMHVGVDVVEHIVGDIDVNLGVDGVLQGSDTTVSFDGVLLGGALPDIGVTIPTTVEAILHDPAAELHEVISTLPDTVANIVQDLTGGLGDSGQIGEVIDTVTDGVGDIPVIGDVLGGVSGGILPPPADGCDSDLTVSLGMIDDVHIPLDVVEAITGDLDIDVTAALEMLGDPSALGGTLSDLISIGGDSHVGETLGTATDGLLGGLTGGDSGAWPSTPVSDLGDTLIDSVLGGGSGGDGGVLAPVGSIVEGIGLLDLGGGHGDSGGGLLGGLGGLGGGKSGGLLGGLFG